MYFYELLFYRIERETVELVKGKHDKQDDDNNGIITVKVNDSNNYYNNLYVHM